MGSVRFLILGEGGRKGHKKMKDESEIQFDNASRLLHFCLGYITNVRYTPRELFTSNLVLENIY